MIKSKTEIQAMTSLEAKQELVQAYKRLEQIQNVTPLVELLFKLLMSSILTIITNWAQIKKLIQEIRDVVKE